MINSSIVWVTPDVAKEYLTHNTRNFRTVNERVVARYAEEMKAGRWQENGDPIQFAEDGTLLNGQHRLLAIVKAGAPQIMVVVNGVKTDVDIYDLGYSRSAAAVLKARGVDANAFSVAAISTFIVENGTTQKRHGIGATLEYAGEHANDIQTAFRLTATYGAVCKKSPIAAAAYCLIRDGCDLTDLGAFFRIANSGLPYGHYEASPALIMRNMLMAGVARSDPDRRAQFCVTIQAFNDFTIGKKRSLRYRADPNAFNLLHKVRVADGLTEQGGKHD